MGLVIKNETRPHFLADNGWTSCRKGYAFSYKLGFTQIVKRIWSL